MTAIFSLLSPSQEVLIIEPPRVDYSQWKDSQIKLEEMPKWEDEQTATEKQKNHGKSRWRDPYKDLNFPAMEVKDMEMDKARKTSKSRKRNKNQIKVTFKKISNRCVQKRTSLWLIAYNLFKRQSN